MRFPGVWFPSVGITIEVRNSVIKVIIDIDLKNFFFKGPEKVITLGDGNGLFGMNIALFQNDWV